MTYTFTATSGNVCLLEIKGTRRPFIVIDATWDSKPSKKDIKQCNEWWLREHPEHSCLLSKTVDDPDQRAAEIDNLLYGGGRN